MWLLDRGHNIEREAEGVRERDGFIMHAEGEKGAIMFAAQDEPISCARFSLKTCGMMGDDLREREL